MPIRKKKTRRIREYKKRKIRKKKTILSNKTKKKVKNYISLSILLLLSGFFLFGVWGYNYLNQKLASASSPNGTSVKDDLFPSFVFGVTEDVDEDIKYLTSLKLVMIDSKSKRSFIYDIPVDMEYDIPGKFSNEEIKKILAFGSLTQDDGDPSGLLLNLVLKLFGFKSDKYLVVDSSYETQFNNFIISGNILELIDGDLFEEYSEKVNTNLDIREIYTLSNILGSIPEDRVYLKEYINTYSDSSEVIDKEIQEFTISSPMNEEKKSIAVLNGSTNHGVAGFGARVIKNLGGRIVAISNAPAKFQESYMVVDDKSSETVNMISDVFNIEKVISKSQVTELDDTDYIDRADIIVVLGFDISDIL